MRIDEAEMLVRRVEREAPDPALRARAVRRETGEWLVELRLGEGSLCYLTAESWGNLRSFLLAGSVRDPH